MARWVWTVDVTVSSHDQLKHGSYDAGWVRVQVAADSGEEARLLACQVAAARSGMPTNAVVIDWPESSG